MNVTSTAVSLTVDDVPAGAAFLARHLGFREAVAAWAIGLVSGLMFTTSDWFTGPLAKNNVIGEYGLGWVATIVISGVLYLALPKPGIKTPASDTEEAARADGAGESVSGPTGEQATAAV